MHQETVANWLNHPVTVELYDYLKELRTMLAEVMLKGGTPDPLAYARSVGQIDTLDRVLSLEFVEKKEEESNDESSQ